MTPPWPTDSRFTHLRIWKCRSRWIKAVELAHAFVVDNAFAKYVVVLEWSCGVAEADRTELWEWGLAVLVQGATWETNYLQLYVSLLCIKFHFPLAQTEWPRLSRRESQVTWFSMNKSPELVRKMPIGEAVILRRHFGSSYPRTFASSILLWPPWFAFWQFTCTKHQTSKRAWSGPSWTNFM